MAISEDAQAIITAIEAQTTALGLRFDAIDTALSALNASATAIYGTQHYLDSNNNDHTSVEHLKSIDGDTNHLATIDADTDHLAAIDTQTKSIDDAETIQLKAASNAMGYRKYSKDDVEADIDSKLN